MSLTVGGEGAWPKVRPGRPRDRRVDEAVLSATLDLLVEQGYMGLSIEGVAHRAGVAKTSLYRRWSSRDELILDAIVNVGFAERPEPADTGSVHEDVLEYLLALIRFRRSQAWANEVLANLDLKQMFRERLGTELTSGFRTIIQRAVDRGELPANTDVELTASLPMALANQHRILTGKPPDEALARRIADQFFVAPSTGKRRQSSGHKPS